MGLSYQTRIFLSSGTPKKGVFFWCFRKVFLAGSVCPLITLISADYGRLGLLGRRTFGYARATGHAEYTQPQSA
jgi:hypothetical protein